MHLRSKLWCFRPAKNASQLVLRVILLHKTHQCERFLLFTQTTSFMHNRCSNLTLLLQICYLHTATYILLPTYRYLHTSTYIPLPAYWYLHTATCILLPAYCYLHTATYIPLPTYRYLHTATYIPLPTYCYLHAIAPFMALIIGLLGHFCPIFD